MKKIIVAFGAAMLALGVQASAVNWHFNISALDCNYEELAGSVALYFNDALLGNMDFDAGGAEGDFVIDNGGGTIKAVAEVTNFSDGAGTLEYSFVIPDFSDPVSLGYPDANSYLASVSSTVELGITNDDTIDTYATVADNGYTPVGPTPPIIPEPTTGLLVLIGVAGLALRRRA